MLHLYLQPLYPHLIPRSIQFKHRRKLTPLITFLCSFYDPNKMLKQVSQSNKIQRKALKFMKPRFYELWMNGMNLSNFSSTG